ncbi:hypothetical protein GGI25_000214 [Coemansia spiralis]|uniref:Uncharacterized protein n=2 Tax=Coemansia TaxID=4863 RepID=A0A9W8GCT6_9FUNG|nr:hypothetical protein BX070DRAFT_236188 [Coemansia spiralis]KAJ1995911.1 hypothetical protein EDC05_000571 [Coemansia umbellata]KAJ2625787.1 hypothetical protein GGI26_000248 [Coemansia sp. RSA 1358]KAJ2680910.1 hypothetical protein GGI25_000214 [Coemansia spiralis]
MNTTYPPQPMPSRYPPGVVESVRQQRIATTRRRFFISIFFQIVFIAVFAALLGYYINRDHNRNNNNNNDGFYYYDSNWFRWYLGLLIALLALDVLLLLYVIWRYRRAVAWLKSPRTTDEQIMLGYNIEGEGGVVIMQPVGMYNQGNQYYQQPPAAYMAPQNPGGQYNQYNPPPYGNPSGAHLYGANEPSPDVKR